MNTLSVINDAECVVEDIKSLPYNYVFSKSLEYFNGDDLAASTWISKYCLKDNDDNIYEATPDDMHWRLAKELSRMEDKLSGRLYGTENHSTYGKKRNNLTKDSIYEYLKNFKYIVPQGSIMSLLGNPYQIGSLSNCIVIEPPYDSYGGIAYTDQQLAQLMKRRCGVGFDISSLRPSGANVNNAAKKSTGTVSFMNRFSSTTREVAQGGRRGALMITIDVRHPEVEQFAQIKQDLTKITGANISIRLTDEFMKCVDENKSFDLRYPVESNNVYASIDARKLWNTIIKCAHSTAEPGLIFWDAQHWYSTSSIYPGFKNSSTNPCSEIAMQGNDSCRLMVVNFFSFVDNPFTPNASFNYEKLYEVTYEAQRLMDDIVELEIEHVEKIIEKIESDTEPDHIKYVELQTWKKLKAQGVLGRRTGLGFTGLADTIAALGIKLDTDESIKMIDSIMCEKCRAEWDSSVDMAIERGPFPAFNAEIDKTSEFIQMMLTNPALQNSVYRNLDFGRRNISISTVAPTGTVSMMTQTSGGIEPVFMLEYMRYRKINPNDNNVKIDRIDANGDAWTSFVVYHPKYKMWKDITGETEVEKSPYFGCTSQEINWEKRIELQSVVQKYVTHSISSTVNLPNEVSEELVSDIYMQAWKKGLKGITVYRDRCRDGVLVSTKTQEPVKQEEVKIQQSQSIKRPTTLQCDIHNSTIKGDKWVFFVGKLENGQLYEIFGGKRGMIHFPTKYKTGWVRKNGRDDKGVRTYDLYLESLEDEENQIVIKNLGAAFLPEEGSYTRIISTLLRHGVPVKYVCEQLHKTSDESDMFTFEKGIARVLKKYIGDGEMSADTCSQCKQKTLTYQEGCNVCTNCGHSACK